MTLPRRALSLALVALSACGEPTTSTSSDAGAPDGGRSCAAPGAPTTPTPPTAASATSDFNVSLNACTRTALALECALGVGHRFAATVEGARRRLTANGVPDHDVGDFPNPGNPNAIRAQAYSYTVPVTPSGPGAVARVFGVTTAGVVLDPGTAERWNDSPRWSYEALRYATGPMYFSGAGATDRTRHPTALGLDCNFAHVQPDGAYHYHGVPTGLMPGAPALVFVGWAGDGYPIYGRWGRSDPNDPSSALRELRSSYRLKTGARPGGVDGPGGAYDGTFTEDWEYVAGHGDLDACNGREGTVTLEGRETRTYHYVLTNTFPYIPRCFHATPDPSFAAGAMMGGDAGVDGPRACTDASQCAGACPRERARLRLRRDADGDGVRPGLRAGERLPRRPNGMALSCRGGACVP